MAASESPQPLPRIRSEIHGFDLLAKGGFPLHHSILVAGTAGCGKTLFSLQYLLGGIHRHGEPGVFVTFEEGPGDIMSAAAAFGWHLEPLVNDGRLALIDASPTPDEGESITGDFDLGGILARVRDSIERLGATRVVLDSAGALVSRFVGSTNVRAELQRLAASLKALETTPLLTVDRESEDGPVSRHGVEQYVTDSVVILRNRSDEERRRRTVEILKFRGADHATGEFPFVIDATQGVRVSALSQLGLDYAASSERVSTGVADLDAMAGGGLFRGSATLVSGATGTGKTLLATHFVAAAVAAGERALLYGFEESREQLVRNAASWGMDLETAENAGLLRIVCTYPESAGLEGHATAIRAELDTFKPQRIALDCLSALERMAPYKNFRQFLLEMTHTFRRAECTSLLTNTSHMVVGAESATETQISTVTDTILLLRYVEVRGVMRRGLNVLKMRGSGHEKRFHEYEVTAEGLEITGPFENVTGILAGQARLIGEKYDD